MKYLEEFMTKGQDEKFFLQGPKKYECLGRALAYLMRQRGSWYHYLKYNIYFRNYIKFYANDQWGYSLGVGFQRFLNYPASLCSLRLCRH